MRWYYFLIVAFFLVLSAFFSMADMVYGAVDQTRLQKAAEKGNKQAAKALKLAQDYEFSISTILFGNNVANIFASSFTTLIGVSLNRGSFQSGEAIATIILTVIIIIFCEFTPKAIGKRFAYSLSLRFVVPVQISKVIFFIFVYPVSKVFYLVTRLFSKKAKEEDEIDEEVLDEMIDEIEEQGIVEEGEADLLREAVDFSDIEAYEIMTPRVDVVAMDIEDDIDEFLKNPEVWEYSRIPVYEGTIDNIVGILSTKVLSKYVLRKEKIDVASLMYKPIVVPRNRQILDLLEEFKKTKIHIAVVIDEYGGTDGIITMEDILEELVGDIFDENDDIEEEYVEKGKGVYVVQGSMNLEDCFELIGLTEEEEEEVDTAYATIGGFCQEILDRFAETGDEFDFLHYHFEILKADEFTVEKIRITDTDFKEEEE